MTKCKTTKDVIIWLRGQTDEINTNLIKDFTVTFTDNENTKHEILITRNDIEMIKHQTNGNFSLVFRKKDGVSANVFAQKTELNTDFSFLSSNVTINKLYVRTGLERYIILKDEK